MGGAALSSAGWLVTRAVLAGPGTSPMERDERVSILRPAQIIENMRGDWRVTPAISIALPSSRPLFPSVAGAIRGSSRRIDAMTSLPGLVQAGRDPAAEGPGTGPAFFVWRQTALASARLDGWEGLVDAQREYLDAFWDHSDVQVEGDPEVQQAVRFGLFHVLQAGAQAGPHPIAAKGLTGNGYDGHVLFRSQLEPKLHDYRTVELQTSVEPGEKRTSL